MSENPRVMVACNTLTSISGETYPYHMKLFYHMGRRHLNYDFMQLFAYRMSIDRFRNWAAEAAMANNCKYLLFIDDDMKLPPATFEYLENGMRVGGYHILAALNYIRGYPFKIMSFKFDLGSDRKRLTNVTQADFDNLPEGSIIPCDAIGTAVCMIDVDIFRKMPKPYFLTGPHGTEDIYMCLKASEYAGAKIGTHTGLQTGHLLEPEIISHETRASLKAYYESYMTKEEIYEANKDNPALARVPNVGKRDLHYEDLMGIEFEGLVSK